MRQRVTCVLLALALAGGVLTGAQRQPQVTEEKKAEPPPPEPAKKELAEIAKGPAAPVDPKTYKIGPEDVLLVRVWREPELSGGVVVRPDGRITLPLIGELQAGGLTPDALNEKVTQEYSKFLNQPEVMVSVQQVNSKKYYISGEVARTGPYPLVVPTTVLQALSGAGGFNQFANLSKIVIMRGDKRLKFNYKDVVRGKNLEQNIYLESGDHIFVP